MLDLFSTIPADDSQPVEEAPPPRPSAGPLALPTTVADIVDEYEQKCAQLAANIAALKQACTDFCSACTVRGAFVETIITTPSLYESDLRAKLLKSGWQAVWDKLNIADIASAKDKELFKRTMAKPPELTLDTAKATFGDYFIRPRFHILRGLAEAFTVLDPAYKSHSKVRLGVKGLPKRVILNYWGDYSSGWGRDRFVDMVNALATYQGKPQIDWLELRAINEAHSIGEDAICDGRSYFTRPRYGQPEELKTVDRGITVRKFANGNAHVFFERWALFDINKALADFYGEVLPDAEADDTKPQPSTAVAKDLQFYWSPAPVINAALDFADIAFANDGPRRLGAPSLKVLEPSCGDGRILDELRQRGCDSLGVEYHAERAAQARAKGHHVITGNFLQATPTADFDLVIMNPPFYGRHYVKHVLHAVKFLKPGGTLVAILPATAHYDHQQLKGEWRDLPPGSFADAGTNVPTGMLRIRAPRAA
jgi:hypothetical protein